MSAPDMPPGLSKPATAHWKHIVGECLRLKLITTLDYGLVVSYIREWDACRELDEQCRKRGRWITETVIDRRGVAHEVGVKRAPWDTSIVQHRQILRALLRELGFTPSARASVSTVDDEEPKLAELLAFDGGKK